jgi:hypothetical protein
MYHASSVALTHGESAGPIKGCILLKDYGRPGATGTVEIYNNTMVDCLGELYNNLAYGQAPDAGSIYKSGGQRGVKVVMQNNIIYAPPYYWTDESRGSKRMNAYLAPVTLQCCMNQFSGSHNLWYGSGAAPSNFSSNLNEDPQFVDVAHGDFRLSSGSPVVTNGIAVPGLQNDYDGVPRSQTPSLGAFQAAPHRPPNR